MFTFDSSWDGFARTAVFECGSERREQLLVGDRCIVPWEILKAGAYLRVGVYGVDGNKTMPTVYSGQMFVARGAEPSEAAREHSADMFDQIVEIGGQVAEAKEQWEHMSAEAETLPADAEATASYADGVLKLGIPKGRDGQGGGGTADHRDLTNRDAANQHPMSAIGGLADALSGKQETVADLETIRSGAALGATAVQPEAGKGLFSGNYNDLTNKPTIPPAVTDAHINSLIDAKLGDLESAVTLLEGVV